MLDVLQEQDRQVELAARVQQKAALLSAAQTPRASDLSGLQTLQLLDWYFDRRLGRDLPDDMEMFAQGLGYHDRKDLVDALLQEYAFFNSTAA
jgi:hypothetical protein